MCARAKVAGPGRAAPAILGLAFLSFFVACGAPASAQPQAPMAQMQQQMIQQQAQGVQQMRQQVQIHHLISQINQLQLQSAQLTVQIADASKQSQAGLPPTSQGAAQAANINPPAESPELSAAIQAVADASSACDSVKQKLLATMHDSAEYKQAAAALVSAQADLERAKGAATGPTDEVVALAYKVMASQTLITKIEHQALDASAAWTAASAKLQEANQSLAALRADPNQAGKQNPDAQVKPVPSPAPGYDVYRAARDKVDAQLKPLMQELEQLSPQDALLVAQEGQGTLEELTQLHQPQANVQRTAAGAPVIHFSAQVSPQVQRLLQGNLDEAARMNDPVYAARKQQEEAEREEQQEQQQADEQARQEQEKRDAEDRALEGQ